MPKIFIGIDPGLDGAVVRYVPGKPFFCWDAPTLMVKKGRSKKRQYDLAAMGAALKAAAAIQDADISEVLVGIEKVHAMPGQGVTAMFNMGRGLGIWEGLIAGLGLPYIYVHPHVWKREMVGTKADKNESILVAKRLFPKAATFLTRKKDHGRAEALLIAEYIRRKYN